MAGLDVKELVSHDNSKIITEIDHRENAAGSGSSLKDRQPAVEFDAKAEARLRRKIDLYIVPTVAIIYLFCFIDRANIGNARLAGFEADLNLTGFDYNQILSIFYVSYIVFEIPSNLACKWIGPGWFLPCITLCFGIVTVSFAFVSTLEAACGVRFLLGLFEAGMLPGIAYYLSRWYRRDELAFRLSLYIVMSSLAGAFGGLLASAILTLDNFGSTRRWQMIFAIEGIITICLALISFFTLTDRPETARWLTEEEKELAIARVKSERVGTTEVLDKLNSKKVLAGIWNPVTISSAFVFLLGNVTVQGLAFFAPTIVRTIYPEKSTVAVQLFTVPPYIVGGFFILLINFLSWKTGRRNLFLIISAPPIMVGYTIFLATTNPQARYGATFLIVSGAFNSGALCNAQVSANVVSDTARSSAIATNVMFGNIGGLIASWSYLSTDSPNYHIGNGLNLGTSSIMLITVVLLQIWATSDNRKRNSKVDVELAGLQASDVENLDWKHPEFRWRL
ncbi:major facilitator superfamily domain-containing protein [Dactylonectria macrodidyma]|uniref:Major facilitator superfamily domain-containing protein n=1 Tax=Dactylonectria macrodidyma TaxID=307937 RepID=A0A9P9FPC8_9HYPO|nr:major facilitator superfamily domain-containing protein [Dactylonectria macrodidyma]